MRHKNAKHHIAIKYCPKIKTTCKYLCYLDIYVPEKDMAFLFLKYESPLKVVRSPLNRFDADKGNRIGNSFHVWSQVDG